MKLLLSGLVIITVLIAAVPFTGKCQVQAQLPEVLCSMIEYTFDSFNNEKRFQSPELVKSKSGRIEQSKITFVKIIKGLLVPEYFMGLKTDVDTPLLVQHGVTVTLANGQKITKPRAFVTTDEDYTGKFSRRSFFPLTDGDLVLLRRIPVRNYKLFNDVDSVANPEDYRWLLNCLTNRK